MECKHLSPISIHYFQCLAVVGKQSTSDPIYRQLWKMPQIHVDREQLQLVECFLDPYLLLQTFLVWLHWHEASATNHSAIDIDCFARSLMGSEPSYIKFSAKSGILIQLIFFINDVYFHFHIMSTPPPFSGAGVGWDVGVGLNLPNFQKERGLDRTSTFREKLVWRGGWLFSGWGCNFYVKDKLKSEIFNDKKSL